MHIAITGNIGAGKTTLAELLAKHYNWEVMYEAVDGNPYLSDFYGDMPKWAFHLQIYFLNSRFEQILKIAKYKDRTVVQDRTIYEDAFIFAQNLYDNGTLNKTDYLTYRGLFDTIMKAIHPPELMIYLKADLPKLKRQIAKRGRGFESNIPDAYLASLNVLYENFSHNYKYGKIIEIDVNHLDFKENEADFKTITNILEKHLNLGTQLKI